MPAADQKDLIVIDPTSGKPVCRKDINLAVVHAGGSQYFNVLDNCRRFTTLDG